MLNRITGKIQRERYRQKNRKYFDIYDKYSEFTMMSAENYVLNLKIAERFQNVKGCVVECGVWRGGVSAGMAELLGNNRNYFLFDSFEGLPPAQEIDGASALEYQRNTDSPYYFDNCKAEKEWAEKAMKKSGAQKFTAVQGWFNDTVPGYNFNEPIAVLRLDGDWYDSTMVCLENLYPLVVKGGLIVIDDYYMWDGCARAVHEYLGKQKSSDRIQEAYSTGCYIIKS